MRVFALAALSVALSVAAQFALKAGVAGPAAQAWVAGGPGVRGALAMLGQPFVLGGLLLYALGAIVWLAVLAQWDVSKAYPLVGLGFAATAVLGMCSGESVGVARWFGVALICAGVWLVARS